MPQIFHRSTNTFSKLSIFGAVFILAALAAMTAAINRSSYVTQAGVPREQPVPFSHQHHVNGVGIDCRYCHTSVESAAFANIPPTKTCMNCHSQIWASSPTLEPVRESFRSDRSIPWTRVHDLPDFVYFDHSIHVNKGVGCSTCHGRVDQMQRVTQVQPLTMGWCLSCHRDPAPNLRASTEITKMDWTPRALASEARTANGRTARPPVHCSGCHR